MVFQEYVLFPWRTVRQNVEFGPLVGGLAPPERQRVAERYLGMVGLADHVHKYPRELSGGMKQRVAIARAGERSRRAPHGRAVRRARPRRRGK
jgi:NitT/TauT family transport system ATP-binding protein